MHSIGKNAVANFVGRACSALVPLALSPYYVAVFGPEGFGLIGIYLMLQSLLAVLDMGYGTTVSRELARLTDERNAAERARNLVRSLEILYLAAALAIGTAIYFAAPALGKGWAGPGGGTDAVAASLQPMALAIAVQFPALLYAGGLMGLQKQVIANAVLAAVSAIRWIGAAALFLIVPPSLEIFFAWQILASAVQSVAMGFFLWSALSRPGHTPSFNMELMRSTWRYSAGVAGAATLGALLVNLDKLVLTQIVPLESFGYYSLAWMAASCLGFMAQPIYAATFPRFCQLAGEAPSGLGTFFHAASQVTAVALLPLATVMVFFSEAIMAMWLARLPDPGLAGALLSTLAIGHALNGLMAMPYALLLAAGHSRFGLMINLVSVAVLAPAALVLALWLGAAGAAAAWVILNIGYIVIAAPRILNLTLPHAAGPWFRSSIATPLAICAAIGGLGAWLQPSPGSSLASVAYIAAVFVLCSVAVALSAPVVRQQWRQALRQRQPG